MKPIGRYIIVENIDQEIKSDFGLNFSSEDKKSMRYKTAKVIKVGTDVTVINDGDIIHYDKSGSHEMIIFGRVVTVILERDVVVVLEDLDVHCSEAS
jgi:co-chaperonin GroES (HSP10)